MKIKSSVLLGFVVLICLLGGLSLMSRMDVDQDAWCPADMYSSVGGNGNSTYSSVSYASGASEATAVPVVSNAGSLFRHRTVSSYAPAHRSPMASSQYPIGGMPSYSSKGASALYTTSSATMKSFGNGGMGAGVAMSGGSVRATSAQPAVAAAAVSMPALPAATFSSTSSAARSSVSMEQLLASAGSEYLAAASYQGIGKTTAGGPMGMRGRRNTPGIGDGYFGWLGNGDYWGEGYEEWANGSDQVTWDRLRALYVAATGDTDFSNQELWESFLEWFNGKQSDETFGWYWAAVPVSDAIPFLLLLCALYAWVVYRRAKKQQSSEQC